MNRAEGNGFKATPVIEPVIEEDLRKSNRTAEPQNGSAKQPYVPGKGKQKASLKDNARVLVIGGGIALVLLWLAIAGIPRKPLPTNKTAAPGKQQQVPKPPENGVTAAGSIVPLMDSGRRPNEDTDKGMVHPEEIARTANKRPKPSPGTNLGSIRPFENTPPWQPEPYQAGGQPANLVSQGPATIGETAQTKSERDALDKASLVFVRNNTASATAPRPPENSPTIDLGIGLAPGTRLRARLESAASTAVQTPAVAVIEYNYERNGEIVVPAGAKAFGRLEAADRSGYLAVRFDSLMLPDGSSISMEAAATDLELRPLKGKVEGKHTGKNILVRSLAGVGEIAATLAGRSSLNQPLSEGDLMREKVSNNIGQSSDQEVGKLAITEHLVVSVPANTEIYVVLEKPTKQRVQDRPVQLPAQAQTANQPNLAELRQLLQLQRELNQTSGPKPSPE
jgi:Bacterial conjugation TrbI-like protein